ncbi:MAG: hypothetical protein ACXACF_10665 [Candidatus Hermodarchaeia archaeon]|jgi:hypothetical protein
MSEVREFRPRLDSRELRFLIHVLRAHDAKLTSKTKELKAVKNEVWRLTRDFRRLQTYEILKQLKAKRTELTNLRAQHVSKHATVCRDFIRRFEELLDGNKPHPKWLATRYLEELIL